METAVMPKWCTYGAWGKEIPTFIGKLERMEGTLGVIRYSENQMYALEYWDMDYVKVFNTVEETILYMIQNNNENSIHKIKECLHFPSDTKNIDWDALRKRELEYYKVKTNE